MTVTDAINQKLIHLPPKAQEEVLEAVEQIEARYANGNSNGEEEKSDRHPLDLLLEISIDGPPDLAERHDYYAHGKLED